MTRESLDQARPRAQVFGSMEERDRWQIQTYGHVRDAFRWPEEPPDGRPMIAADPFWSSDGEQTTYELAVRQNPKRPDELPSVYIARIAAIASGKWQAKRDAVAALVKAKAMPAPQRTLTDAEWNERNNALQAQRDEL